MAAQKQTAVVTGASSGIGRSVAARLAIRGYRLVLIARREEKLREVAAGLKGAAACDVWPMDLSDADAVGEVGRRLVREYESIDVLVNNGGGGIYEPFLELDDAAVRALMEVHYFAPAALMRAVLPGMIERGYGRVINVASIATAVGPWGHGPYAAAKAAMVALTESVAGECEGKGVRLTYVNPGVVKTAFFDSPGYEKMAETVRKHGIEADRVAAAIERCIDRPRLAVTVPGAYRFLGFIKAISPGLAHRMVTASSRPG